MSTKTMTPEEKRIRIAELCGWTRNHDGSLVFYWVSPNGNVSPHATNRYLAHEQLPDYFNDLNAMREAEDTLRGNHVRWFEHELERIVFKAATDDDWCDEKGVSARVRLWHATAEQRAEAFLRIT